MDAHDTDKLQRIADGCDKCSRCFTPIFPGQRDRHYIEGQPDLGGRSSLAVMTHAHESQDDCIDALLNLVADRPAWSGMEHRVLHEASRRRGLAGYDCVTGRVERGGGGS